MSTEQTMIHTLPRLAALGVGILKSFSVVAMFIRGG